MTAPGTAPRQVASEAPEISVVIPTHDAVGTLGTQLEALAGQEHRGRIQVIVVDNRSADGTADLARRYACAHPFIRLVDGHGRTGAGYARNLGARAATGPLLAFCDADDVVSDGWVEAMAGALRQHRFVTGPLELERLNPDWLVGSRGRTDTRAAPWFEGIFPYASSCNLGIRRDLFQEIGGFDESPGLRVGEDLDLSLRLWLAGVPLHYEPTAVVHYRYRPTLRSTYRQARAYGRARPVLGERLRSVGRPGPHRSAGLRNWAWLARHAPLLATRGGRARWVWVAGTRVGNLEGSVRLRRLYL